MDYLQNVVLEIIAAKKKKNKFRNEDVYSEEEFHYGRNEIILSATHYS